MTDVYLIRHCEAEGNLYRRAQGAYNGGISPLGELQLESLAERFRSVPLDAIYASDLDRAVLTAGAAGKYHPALTVRQDRRLRELDMGEWEDLPWGNIQKYHADMLDAFNNRPAEWKIAGAETFGALLARVREAVLEIAARHDGQTVAIASHGMALRTLQWDLLQRLGQTQSPGHGDNTCVTLLHVEGGRVEIEYFNDTSHLPQEQSTFFRQKWWKHEGKGEPNNLRIEPLPLPEDGPLFERCYADAWRSIHGDLRGYTPDAYVAEAVRHASIAPDTAVVQAFRGEEFAGVIDLDTARYAQEGIGWISLLYLTEPLRGKGLGVQLLGHAVSVYRRLGRSVIRLYVSTENPRAIRFYEKYRFRMLCQTVGAVAPLLLMELRL